MAALAVVVGASVVTALTVCGCGYRPVARLRLPADVRSVYIAPPRAERVTEPTLAPRVVTALARELARRGVALARSAGPPKVARLDCWLVRLSGQGGAVVARRALARRDLTLSLSLRLSRGGSTLWRSRLLTVREALPLSADAGEAERARGLALVRLARRAARRAADAMLAGR